MKKFNCIGLLVSMALFVSVAFVNQNNSESYQNLYAASLVKFSNSQQRLVEVIQKSDLNSKDDLKRIQTQIAAARIEMKSSDFWFRYLEPIAYKKINGPLPVEWETEVFEKFEKPYKREGAGLTLASLYIEEQIIEKDSLLHLIESSIKAAKVYESDSIKTFLKTHDHFFLCNRLFLLNLAAIYTTGFECPDQQKIIPELLSMMENVELIYSKYNESFSKAPLEGNYLTLYKEAVSFVKNQSSDPRKFDHYTFIRAYVNPLFSLNQEYIVGYHVRSKSNMDYSLSKKATSVFSKELYYGQNPKGIFLRVKDEKVLAEIDRVGKLLFYDPLLSGNNLRSCASCHKPTHYFTDTLTSTSIQLNRKDFLKRNSPSLINVEYNHLLMLDGKHISLQHQAKEVILNPLELGSEEKKMMEKVLSCKEYKKSFDSFLEFTPQEKEITYEHIVSAITFYYSKFSKASAPFDDAMNKKSELGVLEKEGFNLFMSKAQCATCHFVPQFNGVKPPFVNSEFEVLGVPEDSAGHRLSKDLGRYGVHPARETKNAFRTGSLRNIEHTKPYMHNGVYKDLEQVIEFYNAGGGIGKGLNVPNQTLSSDSLHLTKEEKKALVVFLKSLNENIPFEAPPTALPVSVDKELNTRKVGGEY